MEELEEKDLETKPGAGQASLPTEEAVQHLERAFALEDEDEYEKALEECDTAIRLDPTLADAHNLRGLILEELGRNGEAIQAYREALRLDPAYAAAHENLRAAEAELDEYRISPGSRSLRCRGMVENLRRCPNSASFRCAECGDALCRTHARLFLSPDARSEQDADSGVYCPFHYQTVVDRANLQAVEVVLKTGGTLRAARTENDAAGYDGTIPEELSVPMENVVAPVKEARAPNTGSMVVRIVFEAGTGLAVALLSALVLFGVGLAGVVTVLERPAPFWEEFRMMFVGYVPMAGISGAILGFAFGEVGRFLGKRAGHACAEWGLAMLFASVGGAIVAIVGLLVVF